MGELPATRASRVGGGRRAPARAGGAATVVLLLVLGAAMFVAGVAEHAPCASHGWVRDDGGYSFSHFCYSDTPYLYRERGFAAGNVPYLNTVPGYPSLEYPVLTGAVMEVTAVVTRAVGTGDTRHDGVLFYALTAGLMGACYLVLVWATARTHPHRPWDALMVAVAPVVAASATINWDLFAVLLAALALLAWSRDRAVLAGVLIGLGGAAKLYPLFLLGPLLVLAARTVRWRPAGRAVLGAVVAWLVVNVPVLLAAPAGWAEFWTFNDGRAADFGSPWYPLALAGHAVPHLNAVALGLFLAGCAAVAALGLFAPRRPRLPQLAFLVVAVFLLVNKVYSPQYVLWLLPLAALARIRWRDFWIWQAAEIAYWFAIWWYLAGRMAPGGLPPLYGAAVAVRVAATLWLVGTVGYDVLRPGRDAVRAGGVDDPAGGPFDRAADAPWRARLLGAARGRLPGVRPHGPQAPSAAARPGAAGRPARPGAVGSPA